MRRFNDFADLGVLKERIYKPIMLEILNTYLLEYRRDIILSELGFIGQGCFAQAYKYRDKVFKITTNAEDFTIAYKVMLNPMSSFAHVYNAIPVLYDGKKYFILEVEYAGETVGEYYSGYQEQVFVYLLRYFVHYFSMNERGYPIGYSFSEFLENHYYSVRPEYWSEDRVQFVKEAYDAYVEMFKQVIQLRPKTFDYHVLNITFHNSKIKVVDFGASVNPNLAADYKTLTLN